MAQRGRWKKEEIELVVACMSKYGEKGKDTTTGIIQQELDRKGYDRSLHGIEIKIDRIQNAFNDTAFFSCHRDRKGITTENNYYRSVGKKYNLEIKNPSKIYKTSKDIIPKKPGVRKFKEKTYRMSPQSNVPSKAIHVKMATPKKPCAAFKKYKKAEATLKSKYNLTQAWIAYNTYVTSNGGKSVKRNTFVRYLGGGVGYEETGPSKTFQTFVVNYVRDLD